MKLDIETKFDIGETVYAAEHYYDLYAVKEPYTISDISINISNHGTHVGYGVKQNGRTDHFPAEWLFSTYEECTKWCEAQNKSL